VTLALTRTHPDFDLIVDPISRLRGSTGGTVSLEVRLQNPTSMERTINLPMLARLNRIDASGSEPVEVGAAGYHISYTLANGGPVPNPLRVAGDSGRDLQMNIDRIDDPGNYKGIMRFTAPDRKPLTVNFDLAVRLWWVWAAAATALGAFVAAVLRWYQQAAQPRLQLQRDALRLRSALTSLVQAEGLDLSAQERGVIASMTNELDEASDRLAAPDNPIAVPTNAIESVRRRMPLLSPWIKARRRHDAISPKTVADTINEDLESAYQKARDPNAVESDVQKALDGLKGIDAKLLQAMQIYVTDSVNKISIAIKEFPADQQIDFAPVKQSVEDAKDSATKRNIDSARSNLDKARLQFAEIATLHLRRALAAAEPAIGFATQADWAHFVTKTTRELDDVIAEPNPEHRIERWNEANRRYLAEVVQHAKSQIKDQLPKATTPDVKDALEKAAGALKNAVDALAAGNLSDARKSYEAAIEFAEHARQAPQPQGKQLRGSAEAAAPKSGAEVPPLIVDTAIGSVLPLPLGRGVNIADVNRSLRNFSLVFGAIIIVIAVLSGLQLLYVSNPAFGWADLLVAFLWGAGLHAVAGQAFQGLQGLTQQFR
jgi:hypothetical protein